MAPEKYSRETPATELDLMRKYLRLLRHRRALRDTRMSQSLQKVSAENADFARVGHLGSTSAFLCIPRLQYRSGLCPVRLLSSVHLGPE